MRFFLSNSAPKIAWIFVVLLLLRGVYWFGAYPNSDEAYYWLWGRNLDWSYYDHPPLHAWIQGLFYTLFGQSLGILRLPTVLSSGLVFYLEYSLVKYLYGNPTQEPSDHDTPRIARKISKQVIHHYWQMTVLCTLVSPLYFIFLTMAWHDQWLVTFSFASAYGLIRFWDQYLEQPPEQRSSTPSHWLYIAAGSLGLAFLCKYTALFVGLAALTVMASIKPLRSLFREPRLYGAVAIATTAVLPILIWNANHDWLSFQYYVTRSVDDGSSGFSIRPLEVLGFWGLSILIVSPIISWAIFVLLIREPGHVNTRTTSATYWPMARWLFGISSGLLSLVGLFSTALYYWNILAYLLLLPALPLFFETRKRWFKVAQGLGGWVAIVLVFNYAILPVSVIFGPEGDQDGRMLFGWETVSSAVVTAAQSMPEDPLLLTSDYRSASALAYALDDPTVLAISNRKDQFDIWAQSRALAGKDAIILFDDWYPMTPEFKAQFKTLSAPVAIPVKRLNIWLKNYYLVKGYNFQPLR